MFIEREVISNLINKKLPFELLHERFFSYGVVRADAPAEIIDVLRHTLQLLTELLRRQLFVVVAR